MESGSIVPPKCSLLVLKSRYKKNNAKQRLEIGENLREANSSSVSECVRIVENVYYNSSHSVLFFSADLFGCRDKCRQACLPQSGQPSVFQLCSRARSFACSLRYVQFGLVFLGSVFFVLEY